MQYTRIALTFLILENSSKSDLYVQSNVSVFKQRQCVSVSKQMQIERIIFKLLGWKNQLAQPLTSLLFVLQKINVSSSFFAYPVRFYNLNFQKALFSSILKKLTLDFLTIIVLQISYIKNSNQKFKNWKKVSF